MNIALTQISNLPEADAIDPIPKSTSHLLIYDVLVEILRPYGDSVHFPQNKTELFIKDRKNQFELWTEHPYSIHSNRNTSNQPGVLFAAASLRQDAVRFYFFPLVVKPSLIQSVSNELRCLMQETSVFQFEDFCDFETCTIRSIRSLLDEGLNYYRKLGWVKFQDGLDFRTDLAL